MPATDEDIIRDLLHRCTDHVRPPASIATEVAARQHRRHRRRRVVSLAATGAALGTAAGVIAFVPGHSSPAPGGSAASRVTHVKLTADQRVLYQLSAAAAGQAQGSGRYAVMSTKGTDLKDTTVIDSATGNMWSYQKGSHGSPSGQGYNAGYSPTAAQFAAMPTGLSALRAALIRQWQSMVSVHARPVPAASGPAPVLRPVPVSINDIVFQQASNMLWNPLVGPALRSALYKELAAVPGVKVNRSVHDALGRPAVEISRVNNGGLPGGRSDGISYATYENPATGSVLESTVTYPPGSDIVTPQNMKGRGTIVTKTVYLNVTWASAVPADPYGA
jgi:hypothetical protein